MNQSILLALQADAITIQQEQNIWTTKDASDSAHYGKPYDKNWKYHPVTGHEMGQTKGVFPRTITLYQLHEDLVKFVHRGQKSKHSDLRIPYPKQVYKMKIPQWLDTPYFDHSVMPIKELGKSVMGDIVSKELNDVSKTYRDYYRLMEDLGFVMKPMIVI